MAWRSKSYEVLPALSVRRNELRRSLRLVTAGWMFGIAWMTCVGGSRMNIFARMLGFDDWHFGLLAALPYLATFGQLFATILIERTGLRKYQFIYCMVVSRLLWLAVAGIPLVMPVPGQLAVWLMLSVLLCASFLAALGGPAWFTWMGDLIPRRIRGRYLAARAAATRSVQFPVVIGLAVLMDSLLDRSLPVTAGAQPHAFWAIAAIFGAAALLGTADVLMFLRIREIIPTTPQEPRRPAAEVVLGPSRLPAMLAAAAWPARYLAAAVWQLLINPLRDRVFRRYVAFGATITFAMIVSGPFYWRDMLESVGFSQTATDMLFMVISPLVGLVAAPVWGRLIDRWGRRPVLMLGTCLVILSITPYFFASRHTPNPPLVGEAVNAAVGAAGRAANVLLGPLGRPVHWAGLSPQAPVGAYLIMLTTALFGGSGWMGIMLGQSGIVLGFADGQGRSKYVAAHAVLLSAGGALGGIAGGKVAELVANSSWYLANGPIRLLSFEWNNWHATFLLSLAARVAGLALLFGMPDPGAGKVRDMFRDFGGDMYNIVAGRLFYRLRIFGWGRNRRRRGQAGEMPNA